MWPVIIVSLLGGPVTNVRTNQDGSVVWFASNNRMMGTNQSWPAKVFALDESGPRLVDGRDSRAVVSHEERGGNAITVTEALCGGIGTICLAVDDPFRTTVQTSGGETRELTGRGELSANGRYLALSGATLAMGISVQRIDLQTGAVDAIGAAPWTTGRKIASSGTVLSSSGLGHGPLRLAGVDGQTLGLVDADWGVTEADLSDDGRSVALVDAAGKLTVWQAPGVVTELGVKGSHVVLSNDGSQVAFLSAEGQLQLCNTAVCEPQTLTEIPEGVRDFVWSGDNRVLIAASTTGRVVQIDLTNGAAAQWLDYMPGSSERGETPVLATGSTYRFAGPFNAGEGRTYLRQGDSWLAVWETTPEWVTVQIPWQQPLSEEPVWIAGLHPFEALAGKAVRAAAPRTVGIAHEDFRPYDEEEDTARPGEVLHFFLQGLGPAWEPVGDGQAAPLDRIVGLQLNWVIARASTTNESGFEPLEVVFIGLAPGLVGVYQADVRMPQSAPGEVMNVHCLLDGSSESLAVIRLR